MNTVQEPTGYEQDIDQEPVNKAFLESENHEFDGVKLEPYSPMRIVAAQAMGMHHGRVDPAGMEQFERVLVYPGAVRDVCIVLWLCSIKDELQIDQAARAPVHAAKLAIEWGTAHGLLDDSTDKFTIAFGLMMSIMREIRKSQGVPQQKKIQQVEVQT
jgi:hypothetical protein